MTPHGQSELRLKLNQEAGDQGFFSAGRVCGFPVQCARRCVSFHSLGHFHSIRCRRRCSTHVS